MNNFRYEVHIVPAEVYDPVKVGDSYLGGEVVDGLCGMNNDLLLIVAFHTNVVMTVDTGTGTAIEFDGFGN